MLSWAMPMSTYVIFDFILFMTVYCLPKRKDFIHSWDSTLMPYLSSLFSEIWWFTQSKAFPKSTKISIAKFLFRYGVHKLINSRICGSSFQIPMLRSEKNFWFIYVRILEYITSSENEEERSRIILIKVILIR